MALRGVIVVSGTFAILKKLKIEKSNQMYPSI
jgi:hypothetical protein